MIEELVLRKEVCLFFKQGLDFGIQFLASLVPRCTEEKIFKTLNVKANQRLKASDRMVHLTVGGWFLVVTMGLSVCVNLLFHLQENYFR